MEPGVRLNDTWTKDDRSRTCPQLPSPPWWFPLGEPLRNHCWLLGAQHMGHKRTEVPTLPPRGRQTSTSPTCMAAGLHLQRLSTLTGHPKHLWMSPVFTCCLLPSRAWSPLETEHKNWSCHLLLPGAHHQNNDSSNLSTRAVILVVAAHASNTAWVQPRKDKSHSRGSLPLESKLN